MGIGLLDPGTSPLDQPLEIPAEGWNIIKVVTQRKIMIWSYVQFKDWIRSGVTGTILLSLHIGHVCGPVCSRLSTVLRRSMRDKTPSYHSWHTRASTE